jgi:uncharacterized protein YukE
MSSPGFQSDAAAMTRAVQGFDEAASNAKSTMASLESELQSALARYQGDQAVAFWQLHSTLQDDMRTASNELDTMSNLVNQSFHNYGSGDSQVSDTLKTLNTSAVSGGSVLGRLVGGGS